MKKVIEGRIIRTFRSFRDPETKATTLHEGIDVAAPIGIPIYVPAAGRVVALHDHRESGLVVVVISSEGKRFGFCHLDRAVVSVGDEVIAGQLIAYSGASGVCTPFHLHFSVKEGGQWIDAHEEVEVIDDDDDAFEPIPVRRVRKAHYAGGHFVNPIPYLYF